MTAKNNQSIEELQDYIQALEEENESLKSRNEKLSIDPGYGILTRQALELEVSASEGKFNSVAFLDIDYLHSFNEKHGHDEANSRISRALHFRSSDMILVGNFISGKWYSGDEIAVLFEGDPDSFCHRQEQAFESEGMSITIAWVEFTGDLIADVNAAKKIVFERKAARGVTGR